MKLESFSRFHLIPAITHICFQCRFAFCTIEMHELGCEIFELFSLIKGSFETDESAFLTLQRGLNIQQRN